MRNWLLACLSLLVVASVSGCRSPRGGQASSFPDAGKPPKASGAPTVVPAKVLNGRIARVNLNGRFVVVVFPIGQLPRIEQRLAVFRENLKVGEIKITGPQLDDTIVADITSGEAREGDTVRDQ